MPITAAARPSTATTTTVLPSVAISSRLLANPSNNLIQDRRGQTPYRDRKIHVDAKITPERLEVKVADEGPGFDVAKAQALLDGATDGLDGGRGLRLMRILMDDVRFNPTGNEVVLVKNREQPAGAD